MFALQGYRPPYPASLDEGGEIIVTDEARYLAKADLYVLSPGMCDVTVAAAQTLDRRDLELLTEADLPSLTGVVVLPHPLIVRTVTGYLGDDRAYLWHYPVTIPVPDPDRRGPRSRPAVRYSGYHDTNGPVRTDSLADLAALARSHGTPLPPLLLGSIRCRPLGYHVTEDMLQSGNEFLDEARRIADADRARYTARGLNEDRVISEFEYTPGDEIDDHDNAFMERFLYAFWRLCEQRIATTTRADVNHSAQVVAGRAGVSPDARIIRLRQNEQTAGHGHAGHDWHHRWVVRMHKVRQWYPSQQQYKVIYRGPYIKGPDGKPLLTGETIRGLVRLTGRCRLPARTFLASPRTRSTSGFGDRQRSPRVTTVS
jgi:hypothetical protein